MSAAVRASLCSLIAQYCPTLPVSCGPQVLSQGPPKSLRCGPSAPAGCSARIPHFPRLAFPLLLPTSPRQECARPLPSKGFEVTQVWDDLSAEKADGPQEIFLCQVAE